MDWATLGPLHCKWRAGENPTYMSDSHLCIPRNETVQASYFHNRMIMFCLLIPTSIYLWDIYIDIHDRSVYFAAAKYVDRYWEYINRSQTHECKNWDWGRAIPFPEIHKFNFQYSAVTEKWFGMGGGFFDATSLQKLTVRQRACREEEYM